MEPRNCTGTCFLANGTLWKNVSDALEGDERSYVPYEQRVETYLVPVIFLFIFVLGAVGNGTLVFVFIRHRGIRTVPNIYIFRCGSCVYSCVCVNTP
ncbi:neuropeptide CCHamide-1 receptor-like [Frankliniella occidentalis]|uniref:Neuropeptide CCHamide-1 receptor-like n=1 Tax=Frankliniella occidentalis TaxID=133901 RepID=A0A9C6X359_FRAOC|nr:neuropeptide CCHamide-1 receptor-like [Frankliniella occidentalis]